MQRNFGPLKQQVEEWQALQLSTAAAKLLIYQAFIEDELGFPKHLARRVHELYFQPVHEEFQAANHVEPLERLHQCIQGTGPNPSVQSDGETGGLPAIGPAFSSAYRKCRRTVPESSRLSQSVSDAEEVEGPCAEGALTVLCRRPRNTDQYKSHWSIPMKLRRNEYCPIHRSLFCCGREQARKERRFQLGVQRIEDPHHPRGYRELRSPAEMRKLLNRKIVEQDGKCAICRAAFTDYSEIVPDHIEPKGMGGAWRDDHPDNVQAVHRRCNLQKGSRRLHLGQAI